MTCKTCKHWYSDDTAQVEIAGRGICLKTGSVEGEGRTTYTEEDSRALATATVFSSFGYKFVTAQLETTEDFSCNQFEDKE